MKNIIFILMIGYNSFSSEFPRYRLLASDDKSDHYVDTSCIEMDELNTQKKSDKKESNKVSLREFLISNKIEYIDRLISIKDNPDPRYFAFKCEDPDYRLSGEDAHDIILMLKRAQFMGMLNGDTFQEICFAQLLRRNIKPSDVQNEEFNNYAAKFVSSSKVHISLDGSIILKIKNNTLPRVKSPNVCEPSLLEDSNTYKKQSEVFKDKKGIAALVLPALKEYLIQLTDKSGNIVTEVKTGLLNVRGTRLCAALSPNGKIVAFKNRGFTIGVAEKTNHLYFYQNGKLERLKSDLFDNFILADFVITNEKLICSWFSKDIKSKIKKVQIFDLKTNSSEIREYAADRIILSSDGSTYNVDTNKLNIAFNEQEYVKAYEHPKPLSE